MDKINVPFPTNLVNPSSTLADQCVGTRAKYFQDAKITYEFLSDAMFISGNTLQERIDSFGKFKYGAHFIKGVVQAYKNLGDATWYDAFENNFKGEAAWDIINVALVFWTYTWKHAEGCTEKNHSVAP